MFTSQLTTLRRQTEVWCTHSLGTFYLSTATSLLCSDPIVYVVSLPQLLSSSSVIIPKIKIYWHGTHLPSFTQTQEIEAHAFDHPSIIRKSSRVGIYLL